MIQEEILEYNKLCAEFLGYEISENKECFKLPNKNGWVALSIFHSDWNWIHELIEAIEKLGFTTSLTNNYFHIMKVENNGGTTVGSSKINSATKKEAVVEAINQFLKWYSQNKTV
jgi:hypothetical protein